MSTVARRNPLASAGTMAQRMASAVRNWPWWLQVTALYGGARLVSACIFMAAALHQGANPWFPPKPDYWNFINIWDARWYARVIADGYPSVLPTDAAGNVQENTWAFYPLFPALAGGLSRLTGLNPAASLTLVAMLAGWAAALVVYALFRQKAPHAPAMWGVAFFSTFPVSAVLQVPYAEPLSLLLLAAALLLVMRRQYLWAIPVVFLLCLSRPVGVPFAAMAGLLLVSRAVAQIRKGRNRSRDEAAHSNGDLAALAGLTAVAGISALAWPAAAWAATGDPEAYTKTETVWRGQDLVPFKPWFDSGVDLLGPVLGLLAPLVFVALFVAMLFLPPVVRLGGELRLWCACYMGYLLAFLHPQTSTFRMLMPLFPLALGAVFLSRSKAYRGTVVVMFLLLQIVWIVWLWAWAQLPGGGDYPP
ncbi:hypothetical protein [Pseudarthrobacter sp. BRE9]|uniref:hypothetical protein n=1 Tax=Pseudarthrobacter sp. BRE9 TaxID=2962582 RepID=UPI00288101AC|nr:hypothetical protein [Pseudarthrobacter sp. BRE9]MDT0167731.1 hypothetical protein [Pseudarthrobacter sp. BRE9]